MDDRAELCYRSPVPRTRLVAALGPATATESWQVVSAERPAIVGAHSVEIPLVIADPTGRELGFRLTVTLTPLLDD